MITPEQLTQLRQICQQIRADGHTAKQMAELDFRLHVTLAESTQNELFKVLLAPLINQLRDQIILTWEDFPRPVDLVFEQHEAIVSAVGKGDAEAARQAMTKHLIFSREVLEDISKSHLDKIHDKHLLQAERCDSNRCWSGHWRAIAGRLARDGFALAIVDVNSNALDEVRKKLRVWGRRYWP